MPKSLPIAFLTTAQLPTRKRSLRPVRNLALLTGAVLLAHGALLYGAPPLRLSPAPSDALAASVFSTRTIAPKPVVVAPVPVAPQPKRTSLQAQKPAATTPPAQTLNPVGNEAPHPAQALADLASNTPAPAEPLTEPVLLAAASTTTSSAGPSAPAEPAATAPRKLSIAAPLRIKYDIKSESKGVPFSVNGELLWKHDGASYDARMEISHFLLGSRVQTSTGMLTTAGLEPTRFGDKVRSEVAAHFERAKGKVSFSANTPDVPLEPGAQDQLSVFMQLAALFGGAKGSISPGTELAFQTVLPRSAENWVFKVVGTETIELPGGTLQAIKLSRDAVHENDARAEVWLAPNLGYLPARIRLTQSNGDWIDQLWSRSTAP
jgi:hypothetical protein